MSGERGNVAAFIHDMVDGGTESGDLTVRHGGRAMCALRFGGPTRPLRRLAYDPERRLPQVPLPLAWFDNPAPRPRQPRGRANPTSSLPGLQALTSPASPVALTASR